MLLSYLKLSLRLLVRNPFFTFVNVAGLSVGFVAFFILWQYSSSELKADQYHKDYERIARIGAHWRWVEKDGHEGMFIWGTVMSYQSALIFSDFPQIEEHCRFIERSNFNPAVVGIDNILVFTAAKNDDQVTTYREFQVISADPNLFEFFTIPLIHGDKKTVLKNANSVVLSQKTATRYFGTENPVNRLLKLNDSTTLVVTGVFENLPRATHLNFDIVLSNVGREHQWDDPANMLSWTKTYIKLSGASEFKKMTDQLNLRKERYWNVLLKNFPDSNADMFIQPLKEVAFSNFEGEIPKSRTTLFIFQAVSVVILIMAWINYMNLTVSRIAKRSKEMATRKVSGAHHGDFLKQFLMESLLLNAISLALSFTIIQLVRQIFELTFDIQAPDFSAIPTATWWVILAFIVSGIVITALYPTFLSMRYSPRRLQVAQSNPTFTRVLPSALTTFQYATAFVLISWAFIIYLQLTYLLDKDFLKKDQVIVVEAPVVKSDNFITDIITFFTQVRNRNPATFSNSIIGDRGSARFGIKRPQATSFNYYNSSGGVDESFLPFFEIKLLTGRNFRSNEMDNVIMISRMACARLGFGNTTDAIGGQVHIHVMGASNSEYKILEVVGVYEDYPTESKLSAGTEVDNETAHEGTCLLFKNGIFNDMVPERIEVQINRENFKESLSFIEDTFRKIFPQSIFNWYFLDDHINAVYSREEIVRNQIILFTGMAICIACLGLLGMIANKAEEKVKEIGIRKVMGASMRQISNVLLSSTSWQIMVAGVLSLPIAFYLGQDYLQRYTDQIKLQWWHFTIPIMILVLILLSTVVVVLYKAARRNPVEALKYE